MALFQKVQFLFQSSKEILKKTILNLKFKLQAQDSFLEYFYFGDLKKRISLSEKKPTLESGRNKRYKSTYLPNCTKGQLILKYLFFSVFNCLEKRMTINVDNE